MSESREELVARIKGLKVRLPLYDTEENTRQISAKVEALLDAVEAEGGPIDTLQFALRTACDLQYTLDMVKEGYRQEIAELLRRLDRLQTRIQSLSEEVDLD